MLKVIRTAADLPAPGSTQEMARMEFKQQVNPGERAELAKDVAAFANSVGGTILVGAARKGETLACYKPLALDASRAVMRAYDEAVRDRCSPRPVFEAHEMERDEGHVIAVNVWPFPGQPVGVVADDPDGKKSQRLLFFPLRSGAQTVYLSPDQLPMMMLPEVRRVAILLSQLQEGDAVTLNYFSEGPTIPGHVTNRLARQMPVKLASTIDEIIMRNTVEFIIAGGRTTLPADAIDHVWRGAGGWCISTQFALLSSPGGMVARPTA